MTHLPWPPVAAAGAPCMRVKSGGMERCAATGMGSGAGVQQPPARRQSGRLDASTALIEVIVHKIKRTEAKHGRAND